MHIDTDTRIHDYPHMRVQLLSTAQMCKVGFVHMCLCSSGTFCTDVLQIPYVHDHNVSWLDYVFAGMCDTCSAVNESKNE